MIDLIQFNRITATHLKLKSSIVQLSLGNSPIPPTRQQAIFNSKDVHTEVEVSIQGENGTEQVGRIDAVIDEKHLFDFKTNYMKDWTEKDAIRYGHEHGAQVRSYVDSPDTPGDAQGWIIASVPPDSPDARKTYSDILGSYGVGVKYSQSEQQEDVIRAMEEAIAEDDEDV